MREHYLRPHMRTVRAWTRRHVSSIARARATCTREPSIRTVRATGSFVESRTNQIAECYCGNALAQATTLQTDASCSMACAANSSEACGGPDLLTVYYANKAAPAGPVTNPGPAGWTSYGCWTDGGTRTLSNSVQVSGGAAAMTVALCTAACKSAGYIFAGVEYGQECEHWPYDRVRHVLTMPVNVQAGATILLRVQARRLLLRIATCLAMAMLLSSAAPAIDSISMPREATLRPAKQPRQPPPLQALPYLQMVGSRSDATTTL